MNKTLLKEAYQVIEKSNSSFEAKLVSVMLLYNSIEEKKRETHAQN